MAISIRRAGVNDAALLLTLITELARHEKEENSVKVTEAILAGHLADPAPPFECAIAEMDGKPVGFALYFWAYSTWEGSQTLNLEDLYITPEARGSGTGTKLMAHLASIAAERNCARFEWSCLDWNEPAIGFYRRIGAQPLNGWTRYRLNPAQYVHV